METEAHAAERAPLAWVRVLGCGALRLDFGHAVAVGALGRVLVAGRFDAAPERGDEPGDAGELVQLDAKGAARWRRRIVRADRHCAPSLAIDDAGEAYVLGAFAPIDAPGGAVLVGMITLAITKLDAEGRPVWSVPLADVPHVDGRPCLPTARVAADPLGGARVVIARAAALRVVRLSETGAVLWDRSFVVGGGMFEPGIGVEASGAAVLWGCFSGRARFDDQRIASATWARFLVRLEPDGAVDWAQLLRAGGTDDYSVAVPREGGVRLAAVVRPHEPGAREPGARDLLLAQLDTEGSAIRRVRFRGAAHACAKVLALAGAGDGVALAFTASQNGPTSAHEN